MSNRMGRECWLGLRAIETLSFIVSLGVVLLGATVLVPTPAQAQLNETCTISILNHTAQVQPDGSWRINNIPTTFGAVRARDLG